MDNPYDPSFIFYKLNEFMSVYYIKEEICIFKLYFYLEKEVEIKNAIGF